MRQKKRALVTGIAGFIGHALAQQLITDGWHVTGIDNLSTGQRENIDRCVWRGCEVTIDDYASDASLTIVRDGRFDVVFHLAAVPRVLYSVEHPVLTHYNNTYGTVKLLDACVNNVGRVVFSSSSSVYGGAEIAFPTAEDSARLPLSPYALQKATCEDYCRLFSTLKGLDTVCLRYFNVFGPGQSGGGAYSTVISAWCEACASGLPIRLDGDGEQTRDFCYITNVVAANIAAARSSSAFTGTPVNVAHGEEHSINYVLHKFKQRVGDHIDIDYCPVRQGDVRRTHADITRAHALIGWQPDVSFDVGLDKTFTWWNP